MGCTSRLFFIGRQLSTKLSVSLWLLLVFSLAIDSY